MVGFDVFVAAFFSKLKKKKTELSKQLTFSQKAEILNTWVISKGNKI